MGHIKHRLCLIVISLLLHSTTFAGIYKWVDGDGNVHYSDKPPKGPSVENKIDQLNIPKQRDNVNSAQHAMQKPNNESSSRNEKQRESKSVIQQNCFEERKLLTLLQMQLPIYLDEGNNYHPKWKYDTYKGKRKYLDDKSRALELDRTRKKIKEHCNKSNNEEELEKAQLSWVKAELCSTAKANLSAIQQPQARSAKHEIDRHNKVVKRYCQE